MINGENIGKKIKLLRKAKGISQEKMAEDLNMYQADISNLERAASGSGITDLVKLDMIATYYNIPLAELLGCTDEPQKEPAPKKKAPEPRPMPKPAPAEDRLPEAEPDDLIQLNYTDLSTVYRYRLMVEVSLKSPHVLDDIDDIRGMERKLLKKLKAASRPEKAYQVWKTDLVEAKIQEYIRKQNMVVCKYLFAGVGQYEEILPEEMVPSFKCWLYNNGSAFWCGMEPATEDQIRTYVSKHIADELLEAAQQDELFEMPEETDEPEETE